MIRSILGVVAGLIVAMVIVGLADMISSSIYPLPSGVDPNNWDSLNAYVKDHMPTAAFLIVLCGPILGAFCGTLLAVWIARRAPLVHALIVGGVVVLASLANLLALPHPQWFWVGNLVGVVVAAAAGAYIGRRPVKPLVA